jgi:pimeloyl-ACP methyl ester carboxylesterase
LAFGCVGAYLAVMLAHEAPEIVRGVILMQAPEWRDEVRWAARIDFSSRKVVAKPYLGQLVMRLARRKIAKRWIERALGRPELIDDFVRRTNEAFDEGAGWALASLTQAYFGRPAPLFHPVRQPSLLVWGERDRSHRQSDPSSGLAYLKQGRLVRFERAGHFPELEEPERFAELVRSF